MGDIGELTGPAKDYYAIWTIMEKTGASISDIENDWTLERINGFMSYLEMKGDYKGVWGEYFQQQAQRAREDN